MVKTTRFSKDEEIASTLMDEGEGRKKKKGGKKGVVR